MEKRNCHLPFLLVISAFMAFFLWSCKIEYPRDESVGPPELTTVVVTGIAPTRANSGGHITGDGGSPVTVRGVCWSTAPGPTINDDRTTDGPGTGMFASNIMGLTPNTTYYLRAYATNSFGTSYGDEVEFTTLSDLAAVTTAEVTDITATSATGGGNVTGDGGAEVTARGVVWGTLEQPTLEDNEGFTEDGSGTGEFTSELTGLSPETFYYVRAYATNSSGTAYGGQEVFETLPAYDDGVDGQPCPGMPTFTDPRDGTVYNTVQIGGQCWLKENLSYLPEVSPPAEGSLTDPYYYVYGYYGTDVSEAMANDNYNNYGVLYNWPAAVEACPAGWHLPGDEDWTQLVEYLMNEYDLTNDPEDINGAGNKLKSCRQVNSPIGGDCATSVHPRWDEDDWSGYNHYGTDEFNFSAFPGGHRHIWGIFFGLGEDGYLWSSSEASPEGAWYRGINRFSGSVGRGSLNKDLGFSVRCIRDEEQPQTVPDQ